MFGYGYKDTNSLTKKQIISYDYAIASYDYSVISYDCTIISYDWVMNKTDITEKEHTLIIILLSSKKS